MSKKKSLTFGKALERLGLEEYSKRIFNSNSHGELMHLADYIWVAEHIKDKDIEGVKAMFEANVKHAEENWKRPESVFQHFTEMFH